MKKRLFQKGGRGEGASKENIPTEKENQKIKRKKETNQLKEEI